MMWRSGSRSFKGLVLAAVALAGAAMWCWNVLTDNRDAARAAAQELAACRQLAERIEFHRRTAALAGNERPERQLRRRIDDAAQRAGIGPANLATIQEQPAQRIADTGYQERPTQIVLQEVSIRAATTFFHSIANGGQGVEVKSIRLSAPREQDVADRWTADAIITYRAASPARSENDAGVSRGQ